MNKIKKPLKDGSVRQMIAIALPMVVSLACDTFMVFTDRLFLARISPELMNASMGGGLTVFMMSSFFMGLIGYVAALVAQYFGAGRKKDCSVVVTQAVIIAIIAYPIVLACKPLAYLLFDFMGVSAKQLGPQKSYLNILLYGGIISLLRGCFSGFFSGIGKTAIIMIASVTAMVINVVLNYILVYGKFGVPALGIEGAAYGTVLGGFSGLLILVVKYLKKKNRVEFNIKDSLRLDFGVAFKLLRFGSPTGVEMFLNLLAFNALVLIFHSHSLITATAATIVFNWDMVSFVPLIGIEIGVTSLVGRFMGAGKPEIAHRATMSGLKMGLVYSAFVLMLFVLFPLQLVEVFRPNGVDSIFNGSINLAVFMVRLASLYVLVEAMLIVFIGALRGAGDTLWSMSISVMIHWLMVGILFLVLRVLGLSPQIGWLTVVIMFLVFSILVFLRYQSGKWKKIKMVQKEPVLVAIDGFHETSDI